MKLLDNSRHLNAHRLLMMGIFLGSTTFPIFANAIDASIQQAAQNIPHAKPTQAMNFSDSISRYDIFDMVKKPTTPRELLQNIKFSIDRNLLIRADFYTAENLERFFGGKAKVQTVRTQKNDLEILSAVSNLGDVLANTKKLYGTSIEFDLQEKNENSGILHANVVVPGTSADPRLTVELVENVFGSSGEMTVSDSSDALSEKEAADRLQTADPKGPAPFVGYAAPATHELGNKRIEFFIPKSGVNTSVVFFTFETGQIKNIVINQSEE
ncbi:MULTISPECIES: hypothetical protein [Oxalobacteraceae]|jgi:hypothetical protein|uniref:hypothetical protein n=1 Tax=Oxalobacteraceae TaxID=75682 RepID=UPI002D1A4B2D|nr:MULTISPECIES: hypothetical protein [Oxalobacteraceae]HTD03176.1 hypothetical protein [Undibacterium sp.]HWW08386.1 hypothetical protein [Collimonas sp.]